MHKNKKKWNRDNVAETEEEKELKKYKRAKAKVFRLEKYKESLYAFAVRALIGIILGIFVEDMTFSVLVDNEILSFEFAIIVSVLVSVTLLLLIAFGSQYVSERLLSYYKSIIIEYETNDPKNTVSNSDIQDNDSQKLQEVDSETYKDAKAKVDELRKRIDSKHFLMLSVLFAVVCGIIIFAFLWFDMTQVLVLQRMFGFSLTDIVIIAVVTALLVWGFFYISARYLLESKIFNYQSIISKYEMDNSQQNANMLQEISDREYKHAQAKVAELQNRMKSKSILGLVSVIAVMLAVILFFILRLIMSPQESLVTSIIVAVVLFGFVFFYFKLSREVQLSRYQGIVIEYETNRIQEKMEEDIFENLVKINYKYLDQYYLQVREQAQKSFIFTAVIAGIGAILIFVGIALMFADKVDVSYISAGAGIVTEFISSIFFYLYNKTVTSMSKYHNKLVLSQNISLALRVADSLPEQEQPKVKDEIVKELLKNINSYLITPEDEKKT